MQILSPPGTGLAAAVLTAGTMLLATVRPDCAVTVQTTGVNQTLNQIRLKVAVHPATCEPGARAVIRFRTAGGGVLPVTGLTLQTTYPNQVSFWLSRGEAGHKGPQVEQFKDGRWKTIWRLGT